MKVILETSRTH